MNLETLASVCSALEADFSREITDSSEMGTVETRSSKTLASLSEADKPKPLKEKTLKEVTESSAEKRENSEPAIDPGLAGSDQENGDRDSGETKITGKEKLPGEKGLVEENGASLEDNESQHNRKDGSFEVPIGYVSDHENEEVEESSGEGHEFHVGDFVWGKIKSYPWWPGQVYDPTTASDLAAKMRHRGRVLVAYFGDGTFAWCKPSQLKPFEENFEEMSKQSTMKAFVSAVQQAAEEIGRALELRMACSCVPEQNRAGVGPLVSENAGIKEGVMVPEGVIRKLSDVLVEPLELLAELKRIAKAVHGTDALVVRVLRSRVSAFYRAKGGRESPQYRDPVPVFGLEDRGKFSIKVPAQGPFEEWLPLSSDVQLAKTDQPLLQSCPATSENKKTPRRKQRSIADLIATEETSPEKEAKPSGSKKRKSREEITGDNDTTLTSLSEKAKKARLSAGSLSNISSLKKGKTSEAKPSKEETKEGVTSKGRKTRKKSLTNLENNVTESKQQNKDGSASKRNSRSKTRRLIVDDSSEKPQLEKTPSFRERKKSKYLSPPFTDAKNGTKRKRDAETELPEVSTEDSDAKGIPTNLESNSETLLNKDSTEPDHKKIPIQNSDKVIDHKKADVPTDELLTEVRSAAASPLTPRGKESVDMVLDFMSVFRDSVYRNGSSYKSYKKSQSHRKRKKFEAESGSRVEDPKQPVEKLPETKSKPGGSTVVNKSKGKESIESPEAKLSSKRKGKKERPTPPETKVKTGKENAEGKDKPIAIVAAFGPGSKLPTKAEIVGLYRKYGELDEDNTDMLYNNFCALITFRSSANLEAAYKDSVAASPFGRASVDFTLRYDSATKTKRRDLVGVTRKGAATTPKIPLKPKENGSQESDLGFLKRKLETVETMLEETGGKVSATMVSKLKVEIRSLVEKVNSMVASSSQK